ncbi:MAG: T9SS type A sorting domain-containing protein [Chitinophagales bacterium]
MSDAVQNSFTGIYPNPTSNILNIEIQSISNINTSLIVYDVLGKSYCNSTYHIGERVE